MGRRERNVGSAFDTSDMDHDGFLDKDDMATVASMLCYRLGFSVPARESRLIHNGYATAWENAITLIDGDRHGRIARKQYVGYALQPGLDRMAFVASVVWPITDALWDAMDRDGDEHLDRAEYQQLWAAFDVEGRAARRAFDLLDVNRDGRLSKDEFAQAMYDFYYRREVRGGPPILGEGTR
ncbi:hypothetical protein Misp01_81440 [Microtetraspora sp. NBRC 13810]|uniref:EF-hand domain-containing protein n=1 Tax=Microtetraspora sp. NBRC 13810 TaxID=3030990 RepID=UPI0024A4BC86|nr:EF-hand domain-containing protein [Microtetraspora sp. NBRC 13810]GLW13016.1 hypothetical protein Misp01_81440 [Microtetraspora sp. NBRC 13810]